MTKTKTSSSKKGFWKLLTNNLIIKIAGVAAGILFWVFLSNANDPVISKSLPIPINYEYSEKLLLDEKLIVTNQPSTVNISVSYHQSKAGKISASMFTCTADLISHSGGDLKSQRVYITVNQVSGTNDIVDWSYPRNDPTIMVSMDEYISKTFKVESLSENDLSDGMVLDNSITFTPSEVTVSGPKTQFASVASVKAKVNLQELSMEGGGNISKRVNIALYDSNESEIHNDSLVTGVDSVTLSAVIKRLGTVSVKLEGTTGEPASGYRYLSSVISPDTVTVSGLKSSLADLSEIRIPASVIDITGITGTTIYNVDITPYLPAGVELSSGNGSVSVTVDVEALDTKVIQIPSSDIRLENTRTGYHYSLSETTLLLRVRGFKEDLEVLNIASLEPTIDVSSLNAGKTRVQVMIKEIPGYTYENGESLFTYIDVEKPEESTSETQEPVHSSSEEEDDSETGTDESTSEDDTTDEETSVSSQDEATDPDETTEGTDPSGTEDTSDQEPDPGSKEGENSGSETPESETVEQPAEPNPED
ncbi:MAG: hypothetical protein IIY77_10360 [Lachnospiraceae bacterium]|nr:hypothetical protein [Lachnospiraceae bacterium]